VKLRVAIIAVAFLLIVPSAPSSIVSAASLETLKAQIENTIPHARGQVGVAIKHLESGTEVLVNADSRYPMASTFKLPLLVELYYEKAAGRISLDDRIEVMPGDMHVGSGVIIALFDPPGVQLSIRNLINMMMRVSDNSAADMQAQRRCTRPRQAARQIQPPGQGEVGDRAPDAHGKNADGEDQALHHRVHHRQHRDRGKGHGEGFDGMLGDAVHAPA